MTHAAVCRYVYDAQTVSGDTIDFLQKCGDQILLDRAFDRNGHRAGQVYGWDLPEIIRCLLFISVENAPGAERFANGVWQDLPQVMSVISHLMEHVGWSPFVMENYLNLCEASGEVFPIEQFTQHVTAALDALDESSASWSNLDHPARISGVIHTLAEANYPLEPQLSRDLLVILDRLIDMGDRRSATLQRSETFRNVQRA